MNKNKQKRLTVDIDNVTHSHVKKSAIDQNVTIREWILQAIADKIKKDSNLGF